MVAFIGGEAKTLRPLIDLTAKLAAAPVILLTTYCGPSFVGFLADTTEKPRNFFPAMRIPSQKSATNAAGHHTRAQF